VTGAFSFAALRAIFSALMQMAVQRSCRIFRRMPLEIRIDRIGSGKSPVVVIEDFWPDPRALVANAATKSDYIARSLYYPGLRSPSPAEYARAATAQLRDLICSTFQLSGELSITDSTYSLVATPSDKLVAFQRVPHFDSTDSNRIAVLHYLCGAEHGGTSFYRHRSTGLEVITDENRERYIKAVNEEVKTAGLPPPRFIDEDTPMFERIGKYDCAFNRVLVYSGNNLHSVNTPRNYVPDINPRTGRLTANTFLLASAS
jgi:hypothetical protein